EGEHADEQARVAGQLDGAVATGRAKNPPMFEAQARLGYFPIFAWGAVHRFGFVVWDRVRVDRAGVDFGRLNGRLFVGFVFSDFVQVQIRLRRLSGSEVGRVPCVPAHTQKATPVYAIFYKPIGPFLSS